jgi:hypothetical protein
VVFELLAASMLKPMTKLMNSEEPKFTTRRYPDDLDTTSLALSVLEYDEETIHGLLDDMLGNIDDDGMIEVSF